MGNEQWIYCKVAKFCDPTITSNERKALRRYIVQSRHGAIQQKQTLNLKLKTLNQKLRN